MRREGGVSHRGGDLGRRAAARRHELGLTREEVADRAGMDPGYVAHVEEDAPQMTRQSLYRLAGALNTTQDYLLGIGTDVPPGTATTAVPLPETLELSPDTCMELIGPGGVGRFGFVARGETAPTILPVNYALRDGAVVFRTSDHGVISGAVPGDAAFEVDRVDGATSEGWSVLITGHAAPVTDEAGVEALLSGASVRPWAGGDHDLLVRVIPDRISGRRVHGWSIR